MEAFPDDPFLGPLAGYLTLLCSLQVLSIATSMAGLRLTHAPALAIAAISLAGGAAVWWRTPFSPPVSPANPRRGPGSWTARLIVAGGAALFLLLAFSAYMAPDLSWDGNLYHLPTLQFWAQEGRVHWIDPRFQFGDLANGYPKGAELTAFVLTRALDDPRWGNTLNLAFLPLAVLGIACLAHRLGVAPSFSLAAGFLFLFIPVNVYQSVSTYIDTAYGCCLIAFLAMLFLVMGRILEEGALPWREGLFLAAALGLCLAVRGTGWIPAVWVPVVLVPAWLAAGKAGRFRPGSWRAALFLLMVYGGAFLVGGYWYARNFRHAGNPFYPVQVRLGGRLVFPGRPLEEVLHVTGNRDPGDRSRGPVEMVLRDWLQSPRSWPRSIQGVDSRRGGLGFLWVLGCLPALAIILGLYLRSGPWKQRLQPAVLLIIVGGGIFLATPMNWWARYTVWLYGIGLPGLAWFLQERAVGRRRSGVAGAWAGLLLLVVFAEAGISAKDVVGRAYPGRRPVRLGDLVRTDNWRWPRNYLLESTRGTLLDEILAGHEAVAVGPLHSQDRSGRTLSLIYGQLSDSPGSRRLVPVGEPLTLQDRRSLRLRRVRYLLLDGRRAPPSLEEVDGERVERAAGFWVVILRRGEDPATGGQLRHGSL